MDTFFLLLNNLIPLYLLIALGFIAGRFFNVDRQTLGSLGIYIIMPIVAFGFVAQLDFKLNYIALPLIYFGLRAISSLIWLKLGNKIYADKRANLLSLCATQGNTGYFALPLALVLFSPEMVGLYIFIMLGGVMHETTIMYYIAARGKFNARESIIKLLKFPTLYAIILGMLYNFSGQDLNIQFETYWEYFKGSYVIVGMMIIGVALSRETKLVISPRFIGLAFFGKFVVFPIVTVALIMLDQYTLQIFSNEIYKMLYIMAIVPIAANVSAYAIEMNLNPEKAASTILLSTLFALFYVPFMLALFEHWMS